MIITDAWVLRRGAEGAGSALETDDDFRRETISLPALADDELLVEPLFDCWEGNMSHALARWPIDVCRQRGEERVVLGSATPRCWATSPPSSRLTTTRRSRTGARPAAAAVVETDGGHQRLIGRARAAGDDRDQRPVDQPLAAQVELVERVLEVGAAVRDALGRRAGHDVHDAAGLGSRGAARSGGSSATRVDAAPSASARARASSASKAPASPGRAAGSLASMRATNSARARGAPGQPARTGGGGSRRICTKRPARLSAANGGRPHRHS